MPAYLFEAMDASGSEVRDQIDAANEADAQRELRARGYFVTRLQKVISGSVRNESDVERRNVVCRDDSAKLAEETSRRGRRESPRWLWYVWSSLFLIVGCFFCYELGVRPLWRVRQASGWVETPCTVISSKLKEHRSTDSEPSEPTYSIEIVYKYEFRDSQYQSDRYDFVTMSSNTNMAMRSGIVKAHPPGKQTVCFVNPVSPAEAVLARGWTSEMLWGLFPIPFVLIGVFGLLLCTGVLRFPPRSE